MQKQASSSSLTRKHLLALLSKGLRNRWIAFPQQNGPVDWPEIYLAKWTA
jgi:hypothetical protein